MLKRFILDLFRFARFKVIISCLIFLFLGITHGAGLVMIVPLLSVLGIGSHAGGLDNFSRMVAKVLSLLNIPLTLNALLAVYIVLVVIFACLDRYQTILNAEIQQTFISFLRNRLYRALTHAEWLFIVRQKGSDITHSLTSDIQQIGNGTLLLMQFSTSFVTIIFHLIVAVMLSVELTMIALAIGGVMLIVMKPLNREAYDSGKGFRESRQELYGAVMEHIAGMKIAKSYGAEFQHIQRMKRINLQIEERLIRFTRARANTRFYYEITAALFLSLFFWIAVIWLKIPIGRLLVLGFIFIRLLPKFSSLQQQYQNIKNMLPAYKGTAEWYQKAEASAEKTGTQTPVENLKIEHEVMFQDISFGYSDVGRIEKDPKETGSGFQYAVKDVCFKIPARKITAITGPSGAGKSTLADLLLGLLQPQKGKILVDKNEITPEKLNSWRKIIGYVPQESFLFHDTLRANMEWAGEDVGESEIWEALTQASADGFVRGLPQGLDTIMGDRGVRLSGGERQRIALARALLRKPQLLLLDEATSALDSDNENRIHETIRSLQRQITVVIIAHRESTLSHAHHVIRLENGRVLS